MPEIRTLLVPTDFSADAERALDQAIALARRLGCSIRLFHCYRLPTELELAYLGSRVEAWEPEIRQAVSRQLDELGARATGPGVTLTRELACGDAATEIIRAAATHADLIVMGTLGRSGISHLLLGSVAERTAREAPCPVLVVRGAQGPSVLPKTLLVPIDFSPASDRTLEYAREILVRFGSGRVVLVHAHNVQDLPCLPKPERDSLEWALSEYAPKELEEVSVELRQCGLGCEAHIERGNPAQVITDRARAEHADWIVMNSHGRSGPSRWLIGSVAERVLRTAHCSVLVLRSRS